MWSSRQSGCARVQREICRREDARTEITNALARGMMLQHGIFDLRPTHRLFHPWPGPEVFLCAACFSGSALAITVRASGTETPTGVADVDIVVDRVPHGLLSPVGRHRLSIPQISCEAHFTGLAPNHPLQIADLIGIQLRRQSAPPVAVAA
jgi:hypothetical protein